MGSAVPLRRLAIHLLPSWALLLIAALACSPAWPQVALLSSASILASVWLFVGLGRLLAVRTADDQATAVRWSRLLVWLLLAGLLTLAFAHATGPRQDYRGYIKQWQIILAGADPWLNTRNAYGPLHNLLAWLYQIHPLLPKSLFSLLLLGSGAASAFAPLGIRDRTTPSQRAGLFALLILSPFCLITVGLYANNDILPAAAMTLSLIGVVASGKASVRGLAGALLAIGSLSKFYPLIILPALAIRRRRLDMAFVSGFLATLIPLLILASATWGRSLLIPLLFAGSRESKHLSIFNFTRSILDLNLDRFSTPLMVLAFVAISCFVLLNDSGPLLGAILSFACVLSVYKVGHQQFFLFFFLIAPFALRYYLSGSNLITPTLTGVLLAWLGFLNWYQLEYALTCGLWEGPARPLRHLGAVPYLLLSVVLMTTLLARLGAAGLRLPSAADGGAAVAAGAAPSLPAGQAAPPEPADP